MADEIERIRERWAAIDHVTGPRVGSAFEPGRSYVTWWTTDSDGGHADGVEARAWDPAMLDLARDTPDHVRTLLAEIDRLRAANDMCDGCAGTGKAAGDRPCGCGGTGRLSDMLRYVRGLLYDAERDAATYAGLRDLYRQRAETAEAEATRLRGVVEAGDRLVWQVQCEGGHGYRVHELAAAYDKARQSIEVKP